MDIEAIFKKSKAVSEHTGRTSHGIRHSDILYMKMLELASNHRFTIGETYDMAVFFLLDSIENIDVEKLKNIKPPAPKKKEKAQVKQCKNCFMVFPEGTHNDCKVVLE